MNVHSVRVGVSSAPRTNRRRRAAVSSPSPGKCKRRRRAGARSAETASARAICGQTGRGVVFAHPLRAHMMQSFVLGPMKALLLAAAVFIPFERLASAAPAQRVLRRGWATDAITGLLNGLLLFLVLLAALGGVDAVAAGSVPHLRAWIASWPLFAHVALA